MSTLTVTGVHDKKEWEGKFGPMVSYVVDITDETGMTTMDVEWNRKPESREPQEGERLVGHLEPGPYGEKLKVDFEATKELGGSPRPSGGSESKTSNNSKGDVDWDARNAEIRRQHSQQVAIEAMVLGKHEAATNDQLRRMITDWADWFDQDAIAAGMKASSKTEWDATATEIDLSGARTQEPGTDDAHSWIENLLVVAGCPTYPAGKLATYAVTKLKPDQLKTLESELNDEDDTRKQAGRKRVEASYVKAEGQTVPQLDPDDDIPFHHPEYKEPGFERLRWRF